MTCSQIPAISSHHDDMHYSSTRNLHGKDEQWDPRDKNNFEETVATEKRPPPQSYYEILRKRMLYQEKREIAVPKPETITGNPKTIKADPDTIRMSPDPSSEVFIYNLPADVSLETLKIRFQVFGLVAKVRIARWPGIIGL